MHVNLTSRNRITTTRGSSLILIVWLLTGWGAASGQTTVDTLQVTLLDQVSTLAVNPKTNTVETSLLMKNPNKAPIKLRFSATLKDATATVINLDSDQILDPEGIKTFHISFTLTDGTTPTSGYLQVLPINLSQNEGVTAKLTDIPIKVDTQVQPPPPVSLTSVIFAPLFLAALIVWSSYYRLKINLGVKPTDAMGSAQWKFDSWASTITVASSGLIAYITTALLPNEAKFFSKTSYNLIGVFFAVVIVMAPLVYNFIRKNVETQPKPGEIQPQYQGYVGGFLPACTFTLWGVVGQMIVLILILCEVLKANLAAKSVVYTFQGLLVLLIILMFIYAYRSVYQTVIAQREVHKAAKAASSHLNDDNVANANPPFNVSVEPALPTWSLL